MQLGVLLTAVCAYLMFRKCSSPAAQKDSLTLAAVIGSFYCLAGLGSILFPGTTWSDPPAPENGVQIRLFPSLVLLNWLGYLVAVNGLPSGVKRS
jgi:hypothetical protein